MHLKECRSKRPKRVFGEVTMHDPGDTQPMVPCRIELQRRPIRKLASTCLTYENGECDHNAVYYRRWCSRDRELLPMGTTRRHPSKKCLAGDLSTGKPSGITFLRVTQIEHAKSSGHLYRGDWRQHSVIDPSVSQTPRCVATAAARHRRKYVGRPSWFQAPEADSTSHQPGDARCAHLLHDWYPIALDCPRTNLQ